MLRGGYGDRIRGEEFGCIEGWGFWVGGGCGVVSVSST